MSSVNGTHLRVLNLGTGDTTALHASDLTFNSVNGEEPPWDFSTDYLEVRSLEVTFLHPTTDAMAALMGLTLLEASLFWDTHIERGTQ